MHLYDKDVCFSCGYLHPNTSDIGKTKETKSNSQPLFKVKQVKQESPCINLYLVIQYDLLPVISVLLNLVHKIAKQY